MKRTIYAALEVEAPADHDPMLTLTDAAMWLDTRLTHGKVDTASRTFDSPVYLMDAWINKGAKGEGWGLFDYDCTGLFQLQRIDEENIFESDDAAIAFVTQKAAKDPHGIHAMALALHAAHAPLIEAL